MTPQAGVANIDPWILSLKKWGNRFPNFFTCLVQATALRLILGKNRDNKIHFGVKSDKGFEAHAWVELDKRIVLGEEHYVGYKKIWSW